MRVGSVPEFCGQFVRKLASSNSPIFPGCFILIDQIHVAIGAVGETGTILDAALWAKHGRKCSTKDCAASYSVSLELSVTFVSCFSISAYSDRASRPFFVMLHTVMGYF